MADATQELPGGQVRWFGEFGPELQDIGYDPVPADGKRMFIPNWLDFVPQAYHYDLYASFNCSVLTKYTPVLDVDCLDQDMATAVREEMERASSSFRNAPVRIGKAPKFCWVFRTSTPFRKRKRTFYKGDQRAVVEWLADGQQFVAFGVHPDTHKPYTWPGNSIIDIPHEDLPEINELRADQTLDRIAARFFANGWIGTAPGSDKEAKGAVLRAGVVERLITKSDAPQWAIDALDRLSSDDRDQWMRVAHYLKAIEQDTGECWPQDLWIEWSMLSPKYQDGDEDRWGTIERVTIANPEHAIRSLAETLEDPLAGFTALPKEDPPFLKKRHDYSTIHQRDIPAAPFVVDGLIPRGVPTLLSAHGGTGKSYISLQLAVCVAAGLSFFGHAVQKGKVLFYSCEEPAREINYRLKNILAAYMLTPEDVAENLIIINGYGESDNIMFTGGREVNERLTSKYWDMLEFCKDWRPSLVIIDNISEVYDGNEIDRAMVRQFMQSLNAICKWTDGGLVAVGHVDAATSVGKGGKGYSGSTAWHNSVRSRLFMRPSEVPGRILFEPSKSNYGPPKPTMVIGYNTVTRVFELIETIEKEIPMEADDAALAVLRAIHELNAKGVNVPHTSSGPGNGVGRIRDHLNREMKRTDILEAMSRLFNMKAIGEVEYYKTDRHSALRLVLTDAGAAMLVHEINDDEDDEGQSGQRAKGGKGVNGTPAEPSYLD